MLGGGLPPFGLIARHRTLIREGHIHGRRDVRRKKAEYVPVFAPPPARRAATLAASGGEIRNCQGEEGRKQKKNNGNDESNP
ncbi:hypothetical protein IF1G_03889 [Cordyceps javanica]|uniref:Uncharacterized protein n=1 Tax=Cordyceps javanica TaxID=43265 RepID=A0A545V8U6_9HYPO|nr:hypothetical protein IF1G_03889 [Cordyceps javanica]